MERRFPERRQALVLWAAMCALLLLLLATVLSTSSEPADAGMAWLLVPLVALTMVVELAASILVPNSIARRAGKMPEAWPPGRLAWTRSVIAMALCFGAALFAVASYQATHAEILLYAFAIGLLALLGQFPGEARWEKLRQPFEEEPKKSPGKG
jgi:hypothetical protein